MTEQAQPGTVDGWRLSTFVVDARLAQVHADGRRVDLERSGFAVLRCLIEHAPEVVAKDSLLSAGWPGRVVSENSLNKAISKLRRALGDHQAELIVAVHGYGYRLGAEPVPWQRPATAPAGPASVPGIPAEEPAEAVALAGSPRARRNRLPRTILAGLGLALVLAIALGGALRSPQPVAAPRATAAAIPRVALVPLRDLSSDGSLALLARGIAEHLRQDAQRIPGILVSDPGPASHFQEDGVNAQRIGNALNADLIVGGDIASVDGRLQVELRITDLRGELPPLRQRFERAALEQATLLDDLTLAMYRAFSPRQGRFGLTPGRGGGSANPEAFLAFLRASTTFVNNNDPTSQRRTIAVLQQAIDLDPDYADAILMLGGVLGGSGYYADTPEELRAGRLRALSLMDRGIALAPQDPWNYLLRSEMRLLYLFDWNGALADINAARALAPMGQSEAMILIWQARFLASMNRIDDAIAVGARSIALAPDAGGRRNQGWHYLAKGDTRNARAVLALQLRNYPESPHVHYYLALCDIFERQPEAALRQLEYSSPLFRLAGTVVAQHELGNRDASDAALDALKDRFTPADGYWAAAAHAWRGEADQAFTWLDYAASAGDSSLMYLPFDPHWRRLREDPRMRAWLQRLAPPPEVWEAVASGMAGPDLR